MRHLMKASGAMFVAAIVALGLAPEAGAVGVAPATAASVNQAAVATAPTNVDAASWYWKCRYRWYREDHPWRCHRHYYYGGDYNDYGYHSYGHRYRGNRGNHQWSGNGNGGHQWQGGNNGGGHQWSGGNNGGGNNSGGNWSGGGQAPGGASPPFH